MRIKANKTNKGVLLERRTHEDYSAFNITLYKELGTAKWEYTVEEIPSFNKTVRDAYYKCPWHKVKVFKYRNKECIVENIRIVFDGGGYVLKLNFTVDGNSEYKYITNINSLKYLKLLKFKDVDIVEYLKN